MKSNRNQLLKRKRTTDARIRELDPLVTHLAAELATLGFASEEP